MLMPYSLRPMTPGDIDQVSAMEREAFPTLWPPTSYSRELRTRTAEYMVCVSDGEFLTVTPRGKKGLLGFLGRRNKPQPPQRVPLLAGYLGIWYMAGEAHIVSIAVRERLRRQGLGELLLIGAIELGLRREQQVVTLEARVSNEPAKALYGKYGFKEVGIRRGYYLDDREDATIMTTDTLRTPEYLALFERLRAEFVERHGDVPREYL